MAQVSKYPVSKQIEERIFEVFLEIFIEIKNREEADQFISDFLTPTEKIMLAKRIAIAFLLGRGYDYRTIQKLIKVSAPTITAVNNSRKYGSEGYKKLISKILTEEKLIDLFENTIAKLLSIPAGLEKGSGTWTYLKVKLEKEKRKRKKTF